VGSTKNHRSLLLLGMDRWWSSFWALVGVPMDTMTRSILLARSLDSRIRLYCTICSWQMGHPRLLKNTTNAILPPPSSPPPKILSKSVESPDPSTANNGLLEMALRWFVIWRAFVDGFPVKDVGGGGVAHPQSSSSFWSFCVLVVEERVRDGWFGVLKDVVCPPRLCCCCCCCCWFW